MITDPRWWAFEVETFWSEQLQCSIRSLAYDFKSKRATLYLVDECCTDMSGAIAFCTAIDPGVALICTVAGDRPDTGYRRCLDGQWRSFHWNGR